MPPSNPPPLPTFSSNGESYEYQSSDSEAPPSPRSPPWHSDDHMKLKRMIFPKKRSSFNTAFMVLGMLELSVPNGMVSRLARADVPP